MRDVAVELSEMRGRYHSTLDRIELYQRAGAGEQVLKEAEGVAWTLRREAFPLLVKLHDAGHDTRAAAAGFGWSQEQLQNEHLRKWLCVREDALSLRSSRSHRARGTLAYAFQESPGEAAASRVHPEHPQRADAQRARRARGSRYRCRRGEKMGIGERKSPPRGTCGGS